MVSKQSPVHVAVVRGLTEVVRLLIKKGSSVNLRDENGYTPLHLASYHGKLDIVKLLVSLQADVTDQGSEEGDR
jgi:ankyrin repeat protein